MIEFALSMPFLLLIVIGIMYFGRYLLIAQTLLYAAQEGVRVAAKTPNLADEGTRDTIRGFSTSGTTVNTNSVIYTALASAKLLSQGISGDMPTGSRVEILPWDSDGTAADTIPPGTVAVRIDYPFQLIGNAFNPSKTQTISIAMAFQGQGTPVKFLNFTVSQRAVAAEEIYQAN
jgi:Flp pilus assembly protein TadG